MIQGQEFLPRSQLCKPLGLLLESRAVCEICSFLGKHHHLYSLWTGAGGAHLEAPKVLERDAPLIPTLLIRTPRGACCEDHHLSPSVRIFKSNHSRHLAFAWAHPPSCLPQPPAQVRRQR